MRACSMSAESPISGRSKAFGRQVAMRAHQGNQCSAAQVSECGRSAPKLECIQQESRVVLSAVADLEGDNGPIVAGREQALQDLPLARCIAMSEAWVVHLFDRVVQR